MRNWERKWEHTPFFAKSESGAAHKKYGSDQMLMLLLQVGTYIAALQFSKSIRQISQLFSELMRFCYLISNDIVKFEETTILEVYFRACFKLCDVYS